ncbi:MAG: TIM barrel protein [Chloroflexi bacterium]|nr:TIM barrel protein [Chloroflexota bacterium]
MTIRFSVCVEMIFRDRPFVERLDAVVQAGYDAYEFWRLAEKDLDGILERQQALALTCAAFSGAEGGPLVDPAARDAYLAGLERAVAAARRFGGTTLILTPGNAIRGLSHQAQHRSVVDGLKASLPIVEPAGITLGLEPLNTRVDHAGVFLDRSEEGFHIVDEVNSPNVKLLYDIYHMQLMEGDLIETIRANAEKIGHLHVADVPGRHEPGTGEINYGNVFRAIAESGYAGFVGLEYRPSIDPAASLAAVRELAMGLL